MPILSLMDMPPEVIVKIVDFVVVSDVPFAAQHAIDLARQLRNLQKYDIANPRERQGSKQASGSTTKSLRHISGDISEYQRRRDLRQRAGIDNTKSTASYTDLATLMTAALPTQKAHLRDWVFVTGVCRSIRSVGLRSFFSLKPQIFDQAFFWKLHAGKAMGINTENQKLAISCAKSVILYSAPRGGEMIALVRIQRELRHIQRLGVYLYWGASPLWYDGELYKISAWQPLPEGLETRLRNIGLDMDSMEVGFLCQDVPDSRQRQIGLLESLAYSALDAYADFKKRAVAAKSQ